jgi:hypothetical protein
MLAERLLHDVRLHGTSFSAAQAQQWARGVSACVRRRLCAMRGHEPHPSLSLVACPFSVSIVAGNHRDG